MIFQVWVQNSNFMGPKAFRSSALYYVTCPGCIIVALTPAGENSTMYKKQQ